MTINEIYSSIRKHLGNVIKYVNTGDTKRLLNKNQRKALRGIRTMWLLDDWSTYSTQEKIRKYHTAINGLVSFDAELNMLWITYCAQVSILRSKLKLERYREGASGSDLKAHIWGMRYDDINRAMFLELIEFNPRLASIDLYRRFDIIIQGETLEPLFRAAVSIVNMLGLDYRDFNEEIQERINYPLPISLIEALREEDETLDISDTISGFYFLKICNKSGVLYTNIIVNAVLNIISNAVLQWVIQYSP